LTVHNYVPHFLHHTPNLKLTVRTVFVQSLFTDERTDGYQTQVLYMRGGLVGRALAPCVDCRLFER